MKIPRLTFEQFIFLPEDQRIELQTIASYIPFEVNCKDWTHGQVKDAQDMMSKDITYQNIVDIVGLEIENAQSQLFHVVLGLFFAIQKGIEEISILEAENLGGLPTPKETEALAAMGGFDRFKHFPETDTLAGGQIWMHEAVRNLRWDLCFAKMLYNKAVNDYQKELLK
jgi:hypothetical protein